MLASLPNGRQDRKRHSTPRLPATATFLLHFIGKLLEKVSVTWSTLELLQLEVFPDPHTPAGTTPKALILLGGRQY